MSAALAREYPTTSDGWSASAATALGRIHSRRRQARAADDDGRGDDRPDDRVRERRQPDAGARLRPPARILRPRGARRRPRQVDHAAADRMRRARARVGAARARDRISRRLAPRSGRAARPGAVLHPLGDQRARHHLHRRGLRADRPRLRTGSGAAGRPLESAGSLARRRPRIGPERQARAPAQRPRHRRSGDGARSCSSARRCSCAAS